MIQLTVEDARYHPDIRRLQQQVNKNLRHWAGNPFHVKLALAPLCLPGIAREEPTAAAGAALLGQLLGEASEAVTIWWPEPGKVNPGGELFFEIADNNFYTLEPV